MDYDQFRAQYEQQHPASVPERVEEVSPYPRWLRYATGLMFISSALLSGVHTVTVVQLGLPSETSLFVEHVVSVASFIAVEMAILLAAYVLLTNAGWWVKAVLGVSVVTALAANLYSVVNAFQAVDSDPGAVIVAGIVGIAAPGIAGLSGKLFVDMNRAERVMGKRASEAYREACQAWDKEINKAWKRYEKTVRPLSALSADSGRTASIARTSSRDISDALQRVLAHLDHNPDDKRLSVRDLGEAVGVGKTTAGKGRNMWLEKHQQNGHGE